ncbi:MAG: succinate--CoA ligase subunit alpha [Clostridia bacterium]|nr:succinate--CoA ligase subunit alpha [Clostridia bacterium]
MSILANRETKVLIQGITGREGSHHTELMLQYGTKVVGGTSPGKGGQKVHGIPVFNTVWEAVEETGAEASIIFVPPRFALEALYEAVEAGLRLIICITEGIPVLEMMHAIRKIKILYPDTVLIGPNCPGLINPGECNLGIMPGNVFKPGNVGIISRSGTLTYQIAYNMVEAGIGQSTVIGVGGDPFIGTRFVDLIKMFNEDPKTEALCIIGEIGGTDEEEAAQYIKENVDKPVVAYIAGQTSPPGKRMGHAGAIISGSSGTAQSKIEAFKEAGVEVAKAPYEAAYILKNMLRKSLFSL